MTTPINIGIVGTGMISNVIAKAIHHTTQATLAGISSRTLENAEKFAATYGIKKAFDNWHDMVTWQGIDALYIGVPTIAKEEIALTAARNGKHILADKPFMNHDSVKRMTDAARTHHVAFMDATHFVHHPRTKTIQQQAKAQIGDPQAIYTSFFFPFLDKSNIRYNPQLEPTGALGDMGWYSARAIVEYLPNAQKIKKITSFVQHDPETGAIFRGAGLIVFENEDTATWNIGYNAGVCIMDLDILGSQGLIKMDDFVLDWSKGFTFDDPHHKVGYTFRKLMETPQEFSYIETPSEKSQATLMIEHFAHLAQSTAHTYKDVETAINKTVHTQYILDAMWNSRIE